MTFLLKYGRRVKLPPTFRASFIWISDAACVNIGRHLPCALNQRGEHNPRTIVVVEREKYYRSCVAYWLRRNIVFFFLFYIFLLCSAEKGQHFKPPADFYSTSTGHCWFRCLFVCFFFLPFISCLFIFLPLLDYFHRYGLVSKCVAGGTKQSERNV